jgi:hypothetical protein
MTHSVGVRSVRVLSFDNRTAEASTRTEDALRASRGEHRVVRLGELAGIGKSAQLVVFMKSKPEIRLRQRHREPSKRAGTSGLLTHCSACWRRGARRGHHLAGSVGAHPLVRGSGSRVLYDRRMASPRSLSCGYLMGLTGSTNPPWFVSTA